jgi:hypothetical protein
MKNLVIKLKESNMKKILLIMMCAPAMLAAQNGVAVSNLAVDAGTVTFNVQWTNNYAPDFVWSDTVWVFVDYNNNGVMERLPVTGATASAGTVTKITDNDKGVWVAGNARSAGSFSATVKLFTAIKDVGGACVYGSNYPPVGKYTAADKISFTGTPGYDLVFVGNATTHTESSPYTVPAGSTVQSFIDKTGAPGKLGCIPSAAYTLTASAAGFCAGSTVTFALSNTTLGRNYRLYKDGGAVMNVLPGTGGAATFTGAFSGAGTYTAQVIAESGNCAEVMTGTRMVSENSLPTAPTISHPTDVCLNNGNIVFTASDYSGSLTWVSDGGGVVNGNTVTFASGATTGTKTVIARSAQTYTNAPVCYSGTVTQSAAVNPLPTVASSAGAVRCDEGAVTLTATPSEGAVIDWHDVLSGGAVLSGGSATNSFTTPSISASTVYYAEARIATTGCVSVSRTAVLATVNAVPKIERIGGAASQSVNLGTAITAMTYTASNATSISRSGSTFPSGLNVATSGSSYSIYGTSSAAGVFGYTMTTANNNGCTNATASGTITVIAVTPPNAASANTWTYGGLTWSDVIRISPGCNKSDFIHSTTSPDCRSYTSGTTTWYYYNWVYVTQNATILCPYPWRVPTQSDLQTLNNNTNNATLINTWGVGGNITETNSVLHPTTSGSLWSSTPGASGKAWRIAWNTGTWNTVEYDKGQGYRVVCVK